MSKLDLPLSHKTDKETLESYLGELCEAAVLRQKERVERSRINQSFYLGDQNVSYNSGSGAHEEFWRRKDISYITHNILRPAVDTQVARITKDMPSATAFPATPEAEDKGSAALAQKYIEYQELEHGIDDLVHQVVLDGYLHGSAGFKITYDKDADSISWDPVKIFEILLDPSAKDYSKAKWVGFIRYEDKWEAQALAKNRYKYKGHLNLSEENYHTDAVGTGDEESLSGVEIVEWWIKPSARMTDGLYAVTIGGELVYTSPYPYMLLSKTGQDKREAVLPLVLFKSSPSKRGPLGSTPVDDAVVIQKQHNQNESLIQHLKGLTTDLKMVGTKAELDQVRAGKDQYIEAVSGGSLRWLTQPQLSPLLFKDSEDKQRIFNDVLGLSGLVSGQVAPKSGQSAKSIAYVNELDSYKIQGVFRQVQKMIERGWELDLKLAQVFLTDERMLRFTEESTGRLQVQAFRGSDLMGVDVRLEPRSGLERYTATKQVRAQEQAQQFPQDKAVQEEARSLSTTGTERPTWEVFNRRLAASDFKALVDGNEPTLEADPQVAIITLGELLIYAQEQRPEQVDVIRHLQALYAQKLNGGNQ